LAIAAMPKAIAGDDRCTLPDLQTFAEDKFHEITSGSLRDMIRRTVFADDDETARYSITGVLLEWEDNVARLVATDDGRLGTAIGHTARAQAPVVPSNAVNLLEREEKQQGGLTMSGKNNLASLEDKLEALRDLRAKGKSEEGLVNELLPEIEDYRLVRRLVVDQYPGLPLEDFYDSHGCEQFPAYIPTRFELYHLAALWYQENLDQRAWCFVEQSSGGLESRRIRYTDYKLYCCACVLAGKTPSDPNSDEPFEQIDLDKHELIELLEAVERRTQRQWHMTDDEWACFLNDEDDLELLYLRCHWCDERFAKRLTRLFEKNRAA
jgi:hypothetical protein